jgi:hypothetical protein
MRTGMFAGVAIVFGLLSSGAALADREMVVNGHAMTPAQITEIERLACRTLPDGEYWLDTKSGVFGYVDNPRPQGRLRDSCNRLPRRAS